MAPTTVSPRAFIFQSLEALAREYDGDGSPAPKPTPPRPPAPSPTRGAGLLARLRSVLKS